MKYYYGTKVVSEDQIPKCKICGADLICRKKYSTYSLVVSCSNPDCIASKKTRKNIKRFVGI